MISVEEFEEYVSPPGNTSLRVPVKSNGHNLLLAGVLIQGIYDGTAELA